MTRYTIKKPLDPSHDNLYWAWWRIIKHECVALVPDEKQADIICSMLNDRQEARDRLDLGDAP